LREYLSQQIAESRRECRENIAHLERHLDEVGQHQEETFKAAMTSIDKRFDGVNEFRDALSDLSALMATKDNVIRVEEKFEEAIRSVRERVDQQEKRLDLREGQSLGTKVTTGVLVTIVGIAIALVGMVVVLANYLTSP
jgi:ABC-type transporter Mla subunit MlaD